MVPPLRRVPFVFPVGRSTSTSIAKMTFWWNAATYLCKLEKPRQAINCFQSLLFYRVSASVAAAAPGLLFAQAVHSPSALTCVRGSALAVLRQMLAARPGYFAPAVLAAPVAVVAVVAAVVAPPSSAALSAEVYNLARAPSISDTPPEIPLQRPGLSLQPRRARSHSAPPAQAATRHLVVVPWQEGEVGQALPGRGQAGKRYSLVAV